MKIRRILLIAPDPGTHHRRVIKRLFKPIFPPLGILAVAAVTPDRFDVQVIDEAVQPLTFEEEADVVGLTANTASVMRAYEIATEFRRRGKTVVMGGIHASACPDEALGYVDAVVVGEAENLWPKVLSDLEADSAQRVYRHQPGEFPDIEHLPNPRRDLLNLRSYFLPNTIQTTRGCPHNCGFCSVHQFFGGKYRQRSIPEVVTEI